MLLKTKFTIFSSSKFWMRFISNLTVKSTTLTLTRLKQSMTNTWWFPECPKWTVSFSAQHFLRYSRNLSGNRHADEIARLSLTLMSTLKGMRDQSTRFPRIFARIGVHSGNTVAGVVGSKMPRFCLFGDTINLGTLGCFDFHRSGNSAFHVKSFLPVA